MHFFGFPNFRPFIYPDAIIALFLSMGLPKVLVPISLVSDKKTLVSAFKLSHFTQNISLKFLAKMIYQIEVLLTA